MTGTGAGARAASAHAADAAGGPVVGPGARTYAIRTFGCQMNEHDSARAAGLLESLGYRRTLDAESASLVLLNTCAVRENADERLYGSLGALRAVKDRRRAEGEDLTIVVGGCLAQKDGAALARRAPWVDVVFGTHNLGNLPSLLAAADSAAVPVVELLEALEVFPSALPAKRDVRHHAWVSISVGCDNACTFCIVPALRGPERSRTMREVRAEVEALVVDGVVEVTLLGQNVNSYGRDLTGRAAFADLLVELGTVDGLERIRFTSPHPHDFTLDVLDAMAATPAVCPHLHLPLQSGSDRVLRLMRRSYRSARYLDLVARVRERMPAAALTTDIIVGFPSETEDDFAATLAVVEAVGYDQAFTFQYSPRPGTPAAAMVDDMVAPEVVADRYRRLEALVRAQSLAAHRRLVGTAQELLIESPSRTDPSRWSGRTPGNHLVHLPAPERSPGVEPAYAPGDLVTAPIVDATTNYALAGPATGVRRTSAGRAAGRALAAGDDWRLGPDAPTFLAPDQVPGRPGSRALPVVV